MSDIFKLFDGAVNAGGEASVANQDASSFSTVNAENELVAQLASGSDGINLLVDYSDFANFVFFNSAESYVGVTIDQIINEYPLDGSVSVLQEFFESIDGFQQYFLANWPSQIGHLRFNPAVSSSFIRFDDFGVQDGVARSSFMSPGTGSFSLQAWIDVPSHTGSNDVSVIFQKMNSSTGDHLTALVTGSQLLFTIKSGSASASVSASLTTMPMFFAASCDRSSVTGTITLYTATTGTYPTQVDSVSLAAGPLLLASGSFFIGSGSVTSKIVRPFTGSLDDISAWSTARSLADLTSSFNRKIFAQDGLLAAWRFNEFSTQTPAAVGALVKDCSGHRLDGRIQRYFPTIRGSGSLAYDAPDPIMSLDDPQVSSYVVTALRSGSIYDRTNESLIFKLFPEAFIGRDPASAEVFKNFALILARHYDRIKLYIKQFPNLRRVEWGEFDQAPDELLSEVGRSLGWDLRANFVDANSLKYFLSRDVTSGPQGNAGLDTKLSDIKAQFWRRALLNMMYIYKTKGTRESVEALLRTYGVNNGFVRLKEYARKSEVRLSVDRVKSEKSFYALKFISGSSVRYG